ncbi:dnaJ-like [Pontoporia blainvillei]|uniref:DnaJ-like n=1 Tax=Pontoporia blainvillei TaxID=48723 RepID=A0ABX0S1X6_PONBL|nr:dnaJ-like [Pontoporia blainvillei]
MKKQVIDDFITPNKYLLAARLTSQKLFHELCPVKRSHRQRKYCVVLLTTEATKLSKPFEAFLSFALANTQDTVRFVHVYSNRQQEFANTLLPDSDTFQGKSAIFSLGPSQKASSLWVSILERRNTAGRVVYKTLEDPWTGSESDKFILLGYLDQLRKDPALLSSEAVLPDLTDELAPIFLLRWLYSASDYISDSWDSIFHSNWREMMPLLSLVFSALFILFGTVIIQAFSKIPKKGFVEVTELTDVTYASNLVRLRPGHMNVVLILSNSTKTSLLQKFALEVYTFTGSSCLHFSFLSLDKHREWLEYLLEFAQDVAPIPNQYDKHFMERDYTGYVLALNGHKKYFCLFKPQRTVEEEEAMGSCSDLDSSLHLGESRGKSSGLGSRPIKGKLSKLSLWMERLLEGSLQRFYIPSWPELD